MNFTCIFFGFLFTFAGLWFAFGKGYLHLSLWKNMPQKEKDKLRIVPLCRNIGNDCMDDTCRLRCLVYRKKQPIPQTVIPIAVLHR